MDRGEFLLLPFIRHILGHNLIIHPPSMKLAIGKYYERKRSLEDRDRILAREFWRGQMHGTSSTGRKPDAESSLGSTGNNDARRGGPVHSRHMRSRCALIPRGKMTSTFMDSYGASPPRHERSVSTSDLDSGPFRLQRTNTLKDPLAEKNVVLFVSTDTTSGSVWVRG